MRNEATKQIKIEGFWNDSVNSFREFVKENDVRARIKASFVHRPYTRLYIVATITGSKKNVLRMAARMRPDWQRIF